MASSCWLKQADMAILRQLNQMWNEFYAKHTRCHLNCTWWDIDLSVAEFCIWKENVSEGTQSSADIRLCPFQCAVKWFVKQLNWYSHFHSLRIHPFFPPSSCSSPLGKHFFSLNPFFSLLIRDSIYFHLSFMIWVTSRNKSWKLRRRKVPLHLSIIWQCCWINPMTTSTLDM